MTTVDGVLARIRDCAGTMSVDELARRLDLDRDELDIIIGYGVHHGDLVIDAACSDAACAGCPLATIHKGRCPVLVTIRPGTAPRPRP